jgi:transcriptional regulator with XRE-family HTH domain
MTEADQKKEPLKKEIGRRFKVFRKFIKKSQYELAKGLNVLQAAIANIEIGNIFPGIPGQNYLNIQYHLNLNWLLTGEGEMIISPEKKSKHFDLTQLFSCIDENDPRFEKYVELKSLLRIPVIEEIIFAKLAEIKVIAEEEFKSFFKEK